ncbi:amino acid-binding ACT domain protein [Methanolacinia petrolearia DSM 11571]|uniref:Amino acid-binding ACT domain protein n=1 Tax=Methanolacinia petrolearia (strain DSM 11571 / OCM 486 / SEBR 4847) TaxID=679926 RepID=E1RGG3_METP4|nr:ACT domain-containing protein [Methanolacinia petrolearia]ADN35174.1 amino acid-binding ACT domain protein [Methanolacinia petrolearia DSM 11571]
MKKNDHIIKQISVFSENKPGRLAAIARALQDEKINIFAFSIAEAKGFGVVRLLVDKPEAALKKLAEIGFMVSFTDVIAVRMKDEPGGLFDIARILGESEINIEYSYAYSGKEAAVLILRVDRIDEAIEKLIKCGADLLKAEMFR